MENFIFNGIDSKELGIIVKDMPLVPLAERDIETVSVSGRNGSFHIDNGTYKSINYTITCILKDINKLDLLKSSLIGTSILKLSKYKDRYFIATIKNQISFDKYLTMLNEFPLQLELQPISYSDELECIDFSTSNNDFEIGGNVEISPILLIEGLGVVTINDISLEVLDSNIEIDCDLMNCTKNGLNSNDKVILDTFPVLKPTGNSINLGDGVTSVKISYRKGWL